MDCRSKLGKKDGIQPEAEGIAGATDEGLNAIPGGGDLGSGELLEVLSWHDRVELVILRNCPLQLRGWCWSLGKPVWRLECSSLLESEGDFHLFHCFLAL